MAAGLHHAPAQRPPARQHVEPGHGVFVGTSNCQLRQHLRQTARPLLCHVQVGALDAAQPQAHGRDDARQPHAPQRVPEQVGMRRARAPAPGAVRAQQLQLVHVAGQGPGPVVIFAVHVGRHRAAHRHELGAGRDGQEKPLRHDNGQQIAQQHARLAAARAPLPVEGQDFVPAQRRYHGGLQRRVAVAAAVTPGDNRLVARQAQRFGTSGRVHRSRHGGVAAPVVQARLRHKSASKTGPARPAPSAAETGPGTAGAPASQRLPPRWRVASSASCPKIPAAP